MELETLASQITSVVAIIVYSVVAGICIHTAVRREQTPAILFFNWLVGLFCLAVVGVYLLNLFGILSDPLPAIIGRNIIIGIGSLLGFAGFAIRSRLTRPK